MAKRLGWIGNVPVVKGEYKMNTINTEIIDCGLIYNAHYNISEVKVYGTAWGITIPLDRLNEFTDIFS